MTKISTLLFDLDGTLIDTNELIIQSFQHTFDTHFPGQFTREDVYPFIGPTLWDSFGERWPDKVEEMVQTYRTFNLAHHDEMIRDFETVYETVSTLKETGYRLGIVTSKLHTVALRGLKHKELDPFFDVVIGADDVTRAKPDPEGVLKALRVLDAKPVEAMMIGDNYHDIEAGKNAGTLSVGCSWTIKGRDYLAQFHPDYMLEKMADLLDILAVQK